MCDRWSTKLSLTLNCDGIPVFKSSNFSIWPIQFLVNELPPETCIKHVMMCGLWFGSQKPNAYIFLKPYDIGFSWFHSGRQVQTHVVSLMFVCDSVARPLLQNMTQFNGQFGCGCLHEGQQVSKGRGSVRVYPYETSELRDSCSAFDHAEQAMLQRKPVAGVKGASALMNLPFFDFIWGVRPDYMHAVCLGVVRQIASLWFDSTAMVYCYKYR